MGEIQQPLLELAPHGAVVVDDLVSSGSIRSHLEFVEQLAGLGEPGSVSPGLEGGYVSCWSARPTSLFFGNDLFENLVG